MSQSKPVGSEVRQGAENSANNSAVQQGGIAKVGDFCNTYDENGIAKQGASATDSTTDSGAAATVTRPKVSSPIMYPVSQMGRPRALTPELQQQVCLLLKAGFSRRQAAAYIHVDAATITHAAARDEEFALNMRRAEELSLVEAHLCLLAESRKNWRAAAWVLEQQRKHPRPLSEEEKAAQHQERLADQKRQHELELRRNVMMHIEMDAFSKPPKLDLGLEGTASKKKRGRPAKR